MLATGVNQQKSGNASAPANTMHGVYKFLGLESRAFVEILGNGPGMQNQSELMLAWPVA